MSPSAVNTMASKPSLLQVMPSLSITCRTTNLDHAECAGTGSGNYAFSTGCMCFPPSELCLFEAASSNSCRVVVLVLLLMGVDT